MEWKADYEIGVEQIDQQHRKLVETISRLEASSSTDAQNKEMGSALKFLVDYTHYHFSEEEAFMQKSGFPAYEHHLSLHKDLIRQVMDVLLKLKRGESIKHIELVKFLTNWLANHILEEDQKIGTFIAGEKQNAAAKEMVCSELSETEMIKKLQKLKTLYEKKLISAADYEAKKGAFLSTCSAPDTAHNLSSAGHKFSFFETLQKDHLITKEEAKEHKAILFKQIDLENYLRSMPEIETKFSYLKSLFEDHFITEETYEGIKSKLLLDL